MPNSLNLTVPQYVTPADWLYREIDPNLAAYPDVMVPQTGLYVPTDQTLLDDLVAYSVAAPASRQLHFSTAKPAGYTDPNSGVSTQPYTSEAFNASVDAAMSSLVPDGSSSLTNAAILTLIANHAGGGGTTADWSTITNKPSSFPPSAHTHVPADVTGLNESVQDTVGAMVVAGANITATYDDTAGTLTITGAAGGSTDPEVVMDTIAAAVRTSGPVTFIYDDAGNTLTFGSTATENSTDAYLLDLSHHTGSLPSSQISDATTVGKAVLTAADAPTALAAIGGGTSNLGLGTTSSDAVANPPTGALVWVLYPYTAYTDPRPVVASNVAINWSGPLGPSGQTPTNMGPNDTLDIQP